VANPLLLLPDFLLILLGWLLCRRTSLDRALWNAVERLVYFLLFPVLLFNAIVRSPLHASDVAGVGAAALATLVVGIACALALARWPGVDRRLHASGAQTAYRFNSYIGLALAERLGGAQGLAWMAVSRSRSACRSPTSPRSGRWRATAATRRCASSRAIRSSSRRSPACSRTRSVSSCPGRWRRRSSASASRRCRSG